MRVLVNYWYDAKHDTYEIMEGKRVLFDEKKAVLETEDVINEPLVVPFIIENQTVMKVVDKETYCLKNKNFSFKVVDKDKLVEDPNGILKSWLPKNTDVSKLRLMPNGQIGLLEDDEPIEAPIEDNHKKKKQKEES